MFGGYLLCHLGLLGMRLRCIADLTIRYRLQVFSQLLQRQP